MNATLSKVKKAAIVKGPVPWYAGTRPELLLFRMKGREWDMLTAPDEGDYPVTGHSVAPSATPIGPPILDETAGLRIKVCYALLRDEPLPALRLQPPFMEQAWVTTKTLGNYTIGNQATADCIVQALSLLERPALWVAGSMLEKAQDALLRDWDLTHRAGWLTTTDGRYLYSSVPDGVTVWHRLVAKYLGTGKYAAVPASDAP